MDRAAQSSARRARVPAGMRQVVLPRGGMAPLLVEAPAPVAQPGEALVRTLLVGLDGTDAEVVAGGHGAVPEGEDHLVLGHECLGEVVDAPEDSGLHAGDHVVPLVRHGCGLCPPCRAGTADMCQTGKYREHGIAGLHGFLREAWADDPATLVKVPPGLGDLAVLTEPLSVVVKAHETATALQRRVPWFDGFQGQRVLLAGTGSLGTLAAFLLREEGAHVWAMDRTPDDAFGPRLLARLGVHHFNVKERPLAEVAREVGGFDCVIEATGVPRVNFDAVLTLKPNGVMAMLGVPAQKPPIPIEADDVMRQMVLRNQVLFGSVNSNRHHFEAAMRALLRFKEKHGDALEQVVTHVHPPEDAARAILEDEPDAVKRVVDWRGHPA